MISLKLYIQLLVRILVFVAASLGVAWIVFSQAANILVIVPVALLFGTLLNTINYLNRMNRRIYYLFEAIKNDDSSISFPEDSHTQIEKDLSRSLRYVNRHIQNISQNLQKQEQYYQALIEQTATGIFTVNNKGFILNSNQQARQLIGLNPFTHISQLESLDSYLHQVVKNISPGQKQLVALQKKDSVVQLQFRASAFRSGEEVFTLLSVHDIKNELDEKEIDSWRKLIRVMRHEIMNSVTPITSLSESLIEYFYADGQIKTPALIDENTIGTTVSGLKLIHEQAQGLFRFVESYKQLTRMPEPEPKSFSVNKLLDNICMISRSFPNAEKTELICESVVEDHTLMADEQQITQVMINVVKNAYQAVENTSNARVEISWAQNKDGRGRLIVVDNGPGIDYIHIDKVFIPFFTTKKNGSGIGLSLSRQIMQMHGGSLEIYSVPGKKTNVVLSF